MKRRKEKQWYPASFTVEAALIVPIGFLMLFSLCCLFQMLVRQNDIQMTMLGAVQSYSDLGSKGASLEALARDHVILRWEETEDEVFCYVQETTIIPFLGGRFFPLHRHQQMVASSYQGVSMLSTEEGDTWVYLAENGKVFHLDRDCTYLRTRIQSTTVRESLGQRNQSGGKYYPCESCCDGKEQMGDTTIYLTSYGDRYHVRQTCSKLKRTVRKVRRSQAGQMPACSKCGGSM